MIPELSNITHYVPEYLPFYIGVTLIVILLLIIIIRVEKTYTRLDDLLGDLGCLLDEVNNL